MNFDMRGFKHNTWPCWSTASPSRKYMTAAAGTFEDLVMNASRIIVNRGPPRLSTERGAPSARSNVVTKSRTSFSSRRHRVDHYGGFSVKRIGRGKHQEFYFWLKHAVIKNNSYTVSKALDKNERMKWLNRLVPWYVYATQNASLPASRDYTPRTTVMTDVALDYIVDTGRWNHNNSLKYYASGKAGYEVNKNIEFGFPRTTTTGKWTSTVSR